MQGSFHLGDWLIQPATSRITRDGQTVHVRAKVMDLLVFLAQRPGEVVSKDTLLEGVWGTDALSESALTRSMTELRQALDDDAERPTVIETIPKRGYRVIVPVQPVVSTAPSGMTLCPATDGSPRDDTAGAIDHTVVEKTGLQSASRTRSSIPDRVVWGISGLILGVIGAGLATVALPLRTPARDPHPVRFFLAPPEGTTFGAAAIEPQPAVSPDGRQIATVAMAKDTIQRIWVHSLGALAAQPLAGTEGAGSPFWSPDGRWIGFFAEGKLKKIRAVGGATETLCDAADAFGATWNPHGTVIFAPSRAGGLYSVPATGGNPVALTTLDASRQETSHRFPQFLPDGVHYIYLVRSNRPEHRGIVLGSIGSTERKHLVSADSNAVFVKPGYLMYTREATLTAKPFDLDRLELTDEAVSLAEGVLPAPTVRRAPFSVSNGVLAYRPGGMLKTRLVWSDRTGRTLGTVGDAAAYLTPALSPDAKRLAVDVLDPASGTIDTWIFDLARGVSSRFTFGPALNGYPIWPPDGSRVVFASNRGGTWNLYEKSLNEEAPESAAARVLLESATDNYPQAWSFDGQSFIYLNRSEDTGKDLWLLGVSGSRTPVPLVQTPFNETQAQISPDGRWLAYTSDETGRLEVYVRPLRPSGGKMLVSTEGGCQPRWRADGKELFYVHGQSLMAVSMEAGQSLKPRIPTMLFKTRSGRTSDVAWEYVVTPDGQRFLFKELVFEETGSPLVVVLNWQAMLNR